MLANGVVDAPSKCLQNCRHKDELITSDEMRALGNDYRKMQVYFYFLEILRCSSRHALEEGLTITSDAFYNKWSEVSDKYLVHYDKTAKCPGPLLKHDNDRKHMTYYTKNENKNFF